MHHKLHKLLLRIKHDTTSTDWLIVILTAVIAGTSYYQWKEIKAGGSDTHTLAEAAKAQAEKMKDMSEAAEKIRQAAEGMVTQEQRIADNAKNALDASNRQSKAALNATINQFHQDQRAWVGVQDVAWIDFSAKTPWTVAIRFFNSGRSPARNVQFSIRYVTSPIPLSGPSASDVAKLWTCPQK